MVITITTALLITIAVFVIKFYLKKSMNFSFRLFIKYMIKSYKNSPNKRIVYIKFKNLLKTIKYKIKKKRIPKTIPKWRYKH